MEKLDETHHINSRDSLSITYVILCLHSLTKQALRVLGVYNLSRSPSPDTARNSLVPPPTAVRSFGGIFIGC